MSVAKPASLKAQIFKNLASNYVMTGVGMILGILLVPFMIHKLGTESFGLVSMVESLVLMYELVTISVRQALARYATFSLSANKLDEFREYLSTGRILMFGSAAIVLVVGGLVSVFFTTLFRVPAGQEVQSQWLFFLMTLAFAASIPNSVYWAVLYAHQRFDLINSATSASLIVRALAIFGWFTFAPVQWTGLFAYGVIYCLVIWADNFTVYLWHLKIMPGLRIHFSHFRKNKVREILTFSVHTSMVRLSTVLVTNTVQVCMNVVWGPKMNAYYSVAQKIPSYFRRIFVEPIWTLTPTFTKLVAENDNSRIRKLFFSFSKALSIVTIPICLAALFLGDQIIRLWVGSGFEMSSSLMKLFVFPMMFTMQISVTGCIHSAYGKVKVPSLLGVLASAISAAAGVFLATTCKMGLFGFAWANLATTLLYMTWFSAAYACRISGLSMREYYLDTVAGPFFMAIILWGGFFYGWAKWTGSDAFSGMFFVILSLLSAFYAWVCIRYILSHDERQLLREAADKFTGLKKKGDS